MKTRQTLAASSFNAFKAANDTPYMGIVKSESNVHANWGFWETIKVVAFGMKPHNAEEILS